VEELGDFGLEAERFFGRGVGHGLIYLY